MGARCSLPSVIAKASGTMPKIMARVVIRMGRRRTRAASSSAAPRSMPSSRARLAKSTSKMAFLVTSPMSMITPMMENMLSVLRHITSAPTTPMSVSGSEAISATGCR